MCKAQKSKASKISRVKRNFGDFNILGNLNISNPFENSDGPLAGLGNPFENSENSDGPLAGLGDNFNRISLGNPFGEPERRTRHKRVVHKHKIHYRRRPQYIILRR